MAEGLLPIDNLTGGVNESDPLSLSEDQVVEAVNVDWNTGRVGRKRKGTASVSLASSTLSGAIATLIRHTPTADETASELWGVDSAGDIDRYASGAWVGGVTPSDAISANYYDVIGASLNGKLFLCFNSAVDRLHVWDGSSLRRVGITTPAAPTAADNAGAGTISGTRYYQVAYIKKSGSTVLLRSERSSTLTHTPAGNKDGITVTKPAALSEGETHWELYASFDNSTFFLIAETAVGTTTYNDAAVSSYSGDTPYTAGLNTVPHSAKYVVADENRLIMAGSWENNGYQSDVFWTPVIGSLDIGDDERVVETTNVKSHLTLDSGDGGGITGLSRPYNGSVYAFKLSQVYKLVRTGVPTFPYDPVPLSKTIGCIRHQTILEAPDESGTNALYFLSREGPRRIGQYGIQLLVDDIRERWRTVNLAASTVSAHGIYHEELKQVWWWVATDSSNTPNVKIVFDVRLGRSSIEGVHKGWAIHTGGSANALCSVMFANTLGATVSLDLKPYIGLSSGSLLQKCDTGTTDDSTAYRAYIKTKPYAPGRMVVKAGSISGVLVGKAASGVSIAVTIDRDFGKEITTHYADLTPSDSETRVVYNMDDLSLQEAMVLQFTIGDDAAIDNSWVLDQLIVRWRTEAPLP